MGRYAQLFVWYREIPAAGPNEEESQGSFKAMEKNTGAKEDNGAQWPEHQIGEVSWTTHRQRVEMKRAICSSSEERERMASAVQ